MYPKPKLILVQLVYFLTKVPSTVCLVHADGDMVMRHMDMRSRALSARALQCIICRRRLVRLRCRWKRCARALKDTLYAVAENVMFRCSGYGILPYTQSLAPPLRPCSTRPYPCRACRETPLSERYKRPHGPQPPGIQHGLLSSAPSFPRTSGRLPPSAHAPCTTQKNHAVHHWPFCFFAAALLAAEKWLA